MIAKGSPPRETKVARPGRSVSGLALVGAALAGAAWAGAGGTMPASYLAACIFWGGLSLGSLAWLMIHHLTGGGWGETLRPALLGAAAALPLLALLLLPLLADPDRLYAWAGGDAGAGTLPRWFLDPGLFAARGLLYLIAWLALAWTLGAWGEHTGREARRARAISAGGLVLLIATTSLAAFDWVMSLAAPWYSAVFGLLVGVGQATAALALAVLWHGASRPQDAPAPQRWHDLGNLLLALVLLWSYLALMQFLTIWIADLPAEIRWYLPRLGTEWRWLGVAAVSLALLLPLPLLLSRAVKRAPRALAGVAALVLGGQALYAWWLTLPSLHPQGLRIVPADLAWFVGVGGLWLAAARWRVSQGAAGPEGGAG